MNANLKKWTGPALALESAPPRVEIPHHVLLGEAVDVARFCQNYWQPVRDETGKLIRPGLESAVNGGRLSATTASELLELQDATQAAQASYRMTVDEPTEIGMRRAENMLGELVAVIDFLCDDGVNDADDVRLERLRGAHRSPTSHDAMAVALDEYAAFADLLRPRLEGLGGFDLSSIEQARALAKELRERSARKIASEQLEAQRAALDLRSRLAALLYERMQLVRSAARFVFRNDPDVVRRVTSAYQRQRRAQYRSRAAKTNPPTGTEGAPTAPAS